MELLFNSYEFIFMFLPVTLVGYLLLNKFRLFDLGRAWLAGASVFFYSWWDIHNLPIIAISICFNYSMGHLLTRKPTKPALAVGIAGNLGLLFYFKYWNFFLSNLDLLFPGQFDLLKIALPLGISFFTFTQIAYLVDTWRGNAKEYDLINYILFVTFFPHLIAGPILHHSEMMPQFASRDNKVLNWENIAHGLFLFGVGLSKKVIIADTLATWANPGFAAHTLTMFEAWSAALSYTFQLYFDFSGYTDMALGIALLFNIKLPQNFNSPYKADSIIDFWRRWHMTLSRFLKDYLYIPLGGNRKGKIRRYINLMLTMVIGGLWHGASWTFVFWGFLHGLGLVINHGWRALNIKLPRICARLLTFLYVVVAWVFFRAENFNQAIVVLKGMVNFSHIGIRATGTSALLPYGRNGLLILLLIFVFVSCWKNSTEWEHAFKLNYRWTVAIASMLAFSLLYFNRITHFLYFQF